MQMITSLLASVMLWGCVLAGAASARISVEEARSLAERVCGADLAGAAVTAGAVDGQIDIRAGSGPSKGTYTVSLEQGRVERWYREATPPAPVPFPDDAALITAARALYSGVSGEDPGALTWQVVPSGATGLRTVAGQGVLPGPDQTSTNVRVEVQLAADLQVAAYSNFFEVQYPVPDNAISRERAVSIAADAWRVKDPRIGPQTKLCQFRGRFWWWVRLGDATDGTPESAGDDAYPLTCEIDALTGAVIHTDVMGGTPPPATGPAEWRGTWRGIRRSWLAVGGLVAVLLVALRAWRRKAA